MTLLLVILFVFCIIIIINCRRRRTHGKYTYAYTLFGRARKCYAYRLFRSAMTSGRDETPRRWSGVRARVREIRLNSHHTATNLQ